MDVEEYASWVLAPPRPVEPVCPRSSYFVCATPRCGSWFLCSLLASTGVAGRPHEWFWRDTSGALQQTWGVRDPRDYVRLVLAAGTTPNGVFGAKVMWGNLPELSPFPEPRFVWLRRRDRLAQAVSFAKAVETGHWHHWDPPPLQSPTFRADAIEALLGELEELESNWAQWFEREKVEPLALEFEELLGAPVDQTLRVLGFLGLSLPAGAEIHPLTRSLHDATNDDWAARFRAVRADGR